MMTYFLHDGRNEQGPFTTDQLREQRLSRSTPVRQAGTDTWMPAEKVPGLRVATPRKIRRPKDIVPGVIERVSDLKQRRPTALYTALFCIALFAGISIYSIGETHATSFPPPQAAETKALSLPVPVVNTDIELNQENIISKEEDKKKDDKKETKKQPVKKDPAKLARQKWNKLIVVTNSNYGIGLLGGIKDLKVIVTNHSNFPVDEVVAKLTYVKASGGVWKEKLIPVYDIPANDSKEQPAEDVGRGKKVKVSLYKVVSKKMKLNYTEGQTIENPADPYFQE